MLRIFHIAIILACLALPSPGHGADIQSGQEAYLAGDYQTALEVFRTLAAQGDVEAQHMLGSMYESGKGVFKSNEEGSKWHRSAAEKGHEKSQYSLGQMYKYGVGVNEDFQESAKWLKLAAEQGNQDAVISLGNLYYWDLSDPEEAIKWCLPAAKQGNAEAQAYLGRIYDNGEGVPENWIEAFRWHRSAADQGRGDAQFFLGVKYAEGQGVAKDNTLAYMYLNLSAANGVQVAADRKEIVAKLMTNQEIFKAQELSSKWHEDHKEL